MTRKEKQMLRDLIKNLIKHNRNAWWQLKREIYESGYQGYYPALDDFDEPARTMISSLPIEEKNALLQEWQQAKPERPDHPAERVLEGYARMVVEEVVDRARLAAYRTVNW